MTAILKRLTRSAGTLMLAALSVLMVDASQKIPQTPAGKRLLESLELINSGDIEGIRKYIANQFSGSFIKLFGRDNLFEVYYGFFEKYHGLDFHHAEQSTSENIVGVHRCRLTGSGYLFGLTVHSGAPHKIRGMTILPLSSAEEEKNTGKLSEQDALQKLEAFLDRVGEAGVFSGAVLLSKDDRILLSKAYGWASRRFQIPNRVDTRFNLASLNKMFTAVAVAQLYEKGKLSFDDPIGKYLQDDWIPRKIGEKVRIKHLLSHTSGIGGEEFNLKYLEESVRRRFRRIDDYRFFTAKMELKFEPGSQYSYSNIGVHLLGPIIEKASGKNYYQYLQEHIFEPLGMADTAFFETDQPVPNLAIGYVKQHQNGRFVWKNNILTNLIKGTPAGCAYSTVLDLFKFEQALRNFRLVSETTTNILFSPKPELNSPRYGYGFRVSEMDGIKKVGHTGGYIGINNHFSMFMDKGYTIIILTNIDLVSGSMAGDVEFFFRSLFLR